MACATSAQQVRRNRATALDRARGYTWSTVAERYGITTRRAQQIVREEIETLDQVIEYIADHAARTVNEAIWLGATELKLKVREPGSQ